MLPFPSSFLWSLRRLGVGAALASVAAFGLPVAATAPFAEADEPAAVPVGAGVKADAATGSTGSDCRDEEQGPAQTYAPTTASRCDEPLAPGDGPRRPSIEPPRGSSPPIERVDPTSSPVGGAVTVQGGTSPFFPCQGTPGVEVRTADGDLIASGAAAGVNAYGTWTASFTAPSTAGTYALMATCNGGGDYSEPFEVFSPVATANRAPLPANPTSGWPSTGRRQTYHGRIGPISLEPDGRAVMPASRLGFGAPRPDVAMAVTGVTFGVEDAAGAPVSEDTADLGHVVLASANYANPACRAATFGYPGAIFAAAGAERTALDLPDPYGVVFRKGDQWQGDYELTNRTARRQEVYLTYDVTYRTDLANVRRVTTYFRSAAGCDRFDWSIDGSGTPDVQTDFVTIAEDGELVAAGGDIVSGGTSLDVVDDRGRRLCRSELELGPTALGHGDAGSATAAPESYDDDREIDGITTCPVLREQVRAGERVRVDATYANDRPRSGVRGIYALYVWEGGGPATPPVVEPPVPPPSTVPPQPPRGPESPPAPGATPIRTRPTFTG